MNPLSWLIVGLGALLVTCGLALRSQIESNGKLQSTIDSNRKESAEKIATAKASVETWKKHYEEQQRQSIELQNLLTAATKAANDNKRHSDKARADLRDEIARTRANDPSNCVLKPVHSGIDRRLRDAGANMPAATGTDGRAVNNPAVPAP